MSTTNFANPAVKTKNDFLNLAEQSERINLLHKPSGHISALAFDNLGYQMQYSIKALEDVLLHEGCPHVLQLNLEWQGEDWRNPTRWWLYADGALVASGSGEYARKLFQESAELFLQTCREAVESAGLVALTEHDYRILSCARAIAAHEPLEGNGSLGSRACRVF